MDNTAIKNAMTIRLDNALPEYPKFVEGIRRAPAQRHPAVHQGASALQRRRPKPR